MKKQKIVSSFVTLSLCAAMAVNASAISQTSLTNDKGETGEYIIKLSKTPVYDAADNYADAATAQKTTEHRALEINAQQSKVKKALRQSFSGVEVEFSYDRVFNGLAVKATEEQIEKIKALPDVVAIYNCTKPIFRINDGEANESESDTPYQIAEDIGIDAMSADMSDGFNKGEGNVIAVIDSGFDINHEVYKISDISKASLKTKDDVAKFIDKNLSIGEVTVNQVFKNNKIPFAYDYADNDADVYNKKEAHGMHVSGIVAANGDKLKGVSPESQLVLMKVSEDDTGTIRTAPLIAALNDAVKMSVDCINMSIGAAYTNSSDADPYYEAIENLKSTKTEFIVSAGNAGFGYNDSNQAYAEEVNYATGGTPAGMRGCQTVANAVGGQVTTDGNIMYDGLGNDYFYVQEGGSSFTADLLGTHDFVVAGYGTADELAKVDISGKLVVVKQGSPDGSQHTSYDKRVAIQGLGGIGMLFATKMHSSLYDTEGFPAAVIYEDTYEALEEMGSGTLRITDEEKSLVADMMINDSSSYVMNEYLTKTVGISAPGTFVYSSLNDDTYGEMTGTSMAAPAVCGAYSLAMSWFTQKFEAYSNAFVNPYDLKNKVFAMMQNTSDPIVNPNNNNLYTPRLQGAGYINLSDMINSRVVVTDAETREGMTYIGETNDNSFSFKVSVENLSDEEITYDSITARSIIDDVEDGIIIGSKEYSAEFTLPQSITVAAGSFATFDVTVSITEEQRAALDATFENGFFLDGYLFLNIADNSSEEIVYPFTSFIGDWTKAPMIDDGYYDEESLYQGTCFLSVDKEKGIGLVCGSNPDGTYDKNKIAFSTVGAYTPFLRTFLLRPADIFEIYIDGTIMIEDTDYCNYDITEVDLSSIMENLQEGKHTIALKTANLNGCTQTVSYDFYLDNTTPVINSVGFEDDKLTLSFSENFDCYIACCKSGDNIVYATVMPEGEGEYTAVFDTLPESEDGVYEIGISDNAYNEVSIWYSPTQELVAIDDGCEQTDDGYAFSYKIENCQLGETSFTPIFAIFDETGRITGTYIGEESTLSLGGEKVLTWNIKTAMLQSGYKTCLYLLKDTNSLTPLSPKSEMIFE